jgi:hypothetical protein
MSMLLSTLESAGRVLDVNPIYDYWQITLIVNTFKSDHVKIYKETQHYVWILHTQVLSMNILLRAGNKITFYF